MTEQRVPYRFHIGGEDNTTPEMIRKWRTYYNVLDKVEAEMRAIGNNPNCSEPSMKRGNLEAWEAYYAQLENS